jgi:hypothetical protein
LIQNAPKVRHVVGMGIDGKSGTDFFREMPSTVMARGNMGSFSLGGVVLDAHVRKRDLSAHHLKSMPFGHGALALGGGAVRTEFREVVVDPFFQLVIEDYAEAPSAPAFNLVRRFLVEPVEVGVMVSFAWFGEAKVRACSLPALLFSVRKRWPDLVSVSNRREPFSS